MPRYDSKRIEARWQKFWDDNQTFATPDEPTGGEKLYVLDMFPYPSGSGLHVGHPEGYTATDIVCRYSRMIGKHVLHPMGWDAFGLPAEQHAIKTGTHPRDTTRRNIDEFRRQLKMLGFSYDWSREISTTHPKYYRWTQWIFLQLHDTWFDPDCEWTAEDGITRTGKGRPISELPIPAAVEHLGEEAVRRYQDSKRLAYQQEAPVNWCADLGTVLSNEEVIDGLSERGGHPVERIPLRQWMLRITEYADRLLAGLETVNWPDSIKALQRNWIGRSTGAEVDFFIGTESVSDLPGAAIQWRAVRAGTGLPERAGADVLRVYTTRPDTLYGATYMVLAPEHPFVSRLTTAHQKDAVDEYCRKASMKSDLDRTDLAREKTGVFTGSFAVNPVNGNEIPVWVADYVLATYGTGAIMAVPAHDLRDFEFAVEFGLPVVPVVQAPEDYRHSKDELALTTELNGRPFTPFSGTGVAINSGTHNGTPTEEFKTNIIVALSQHGLGRDAVNFKLRDWLFSRQHFWGEPFPLWHELDDNGNLTGLVRTDLPEDLPVTLPEDFDFAPHGRPDPPLEEAGDEWLYRTDNDGTRLKRETNSMPQWAGSCWYFLRFCDPHNDNALIDPEREKYWMPVDLYIGGAEHAVLHLLYARFWHQVLFDRGHVTTAEPFTRLINQGMILGEAEVTGFQDAGGQWVSVRDTEEIQNKEGLAVRVKRGTTIPLNAVSVESADIVKKGEHFVLEADPNIVVESRAFKMSKSRGNVINPDEVVQQYGADSLRLYEMFMGPLEQTKPWNMSGVEGVFRFLARVWRMVTDAQSDDITLHEAVNDADPTDDQLRLINRTVDAVTRDIEKLSFNTAISRMMEFTNEMSQQDSRPRAILEPFILILSPFAPHLAEELWHVLGHDDTLARTAWPRVDEKWLIDDEIEIPVSVNGKVRSRLRIAADADKSAMQTAAEADENVQKNIEGKTIVKVIVVPGRMVNFVVR